MSHLDDYRRGHIPHNAENARITSLVPNALVEDISEGDESLVKLLEEYYNFMHLSGQVYRLEVIRSSDAFQNTAELTTNIATSGGSGRDLTLDLSVFIENDKTEGKVVSATPNNPGYNYHLNDTITVTIGQHTADFRVAEINSNPSELLQKLESSRDLDEMDEKFLDQIQAEIATEIPNAANIDKRSMYKLLSDFYRTRGSEESIQNFFRLFYGDNVTFSYPGDITFKPSVGDNTQILSDGAVDANKEVTIRTGTRRYPFTGKIKPTTSVASTDVFLKSGSDSPKVATPVKSIHSLFGKKGLDGVYIDQSPELFKIDTATLSGFTVHPEHINLKTKLSYSAEDVPHRITIKRKRRVKTPTGDVNFGDITSTEADIQQHYFNRDITRQPSYYLWGTFRPFGTRGGKVKWFKAHDGFGDWTNTNNSPHATASNAFLQGVELSYNSSTDNWEYRAVEIRPGNNVKQIKGLINSSKSVETYINLSLKEKKFGERIAIPPELRGDMPPFVGEDYIWNNNALIPDGKGVTWKPFWAPVGISIDQPQLNSKYRYDSPNFISNTDPYIKILKIDDKWSIVNCRKKYDEIDTITVSGGATVEINSTRNDGSAVDSIFNFDGTYTKVSQYDSILWHGQTAGRGFAPGPEYWGSPTTFTHTVKNLPTWKDYTFNIDTSYLITDRDYLTDTSPVGDLGRFNGSYSFESTVQQQDDYYLHTYKNDSNSGLKFIQTSGSNAPTITVGLSDYYFGTGNSPNAYDWKEGKSYSQDLHYTYISDTNIDLDSPNAELNNSPIPIYEGYARIADYEFGSPTRSLGPNPGPFAISGVSDADRLRFFGSSATINALWFPGYPQGDGSTLRGVALNNPQFPLEEFSNKNPTTYVAYQDRFYGTDAVEPFFAWIEDKWRYCEYTDGLESVKRVYPLDSPNWNSILGIVGGAGAFGKFWVWDSPHFGTGNFPIAQADLGGFTDSPPYGSSSARSGWPKGPYDTGTGRDANYIHASPSYDQLTSETHYRVTPFIRNENLYSEARDAIEFDRGSNLDPYRHKIGTIVEVLSSPGVSYNLSSWGKTEYESDTSGAGVRPAGINIYSGETLLTNDVYESIVLSDLPSKRFYRDSAQNLAPWTSRKSAGSINLDYTAITSNDSPAIIYFQDSASPSTAAYDELDTVNFSPVTRAGARVGALQLETLNYSPIGVSNKNQTTVLDSPVYDLTQQRYYIFDFSPHLTFPLAYDSPGVVHNAADLEYVITQAGIMNGTYIFDADSGANSPIYFKNDSPLKQIQITPAGTKLIHTIDSPNSGNIPSNSPHNSPNGTGNYFDSPTLAGNLLEFGSTINTKIKLTGVKTKAGMYLPIASRVDTKKAQSATTDRAHVATLFANKKATVVDTLLPVKNNVVSDAPLSEYNFARNDNYKKTQHLIMPQSAAGKRFGSATTIGQKQNFFVKALSEADVYYYDNCPTNASNTPTPTKIYAGGQHIFSSAYTNSSDTPSIGYIISTGNVMVSTVAYDSPTQEPKGASILTPLATNAFARNAGTLKIYDEELNSYSPGSSEVTTFDILDDTSSQSPRFTGVVAQHATKNLFIADIDDGSGEDQIASISRRNMADTYVYGNSIADYCVISPYVNTVQVSYQLFENSPNNGEYIYKVHTFDSPTSLNSPKGIQVYGTDSPNWIANNSPNYFANPALISHQSPNGFVLDPLTSVTVSGAGTGGVNGTYSAYTGSLTHLNPKTGTTVFKNGSFYLYQLNSSSQWRIDTDEEEDNGYYRNTSTTDNPPTSGWTDVGEGDAPGPTLSYTLPSYRSTGVTPKLWKFKGRRPFALIINNTNLEETQVGINTNEYNVAVSQEQNATGKRTVQIRDISEAGVITDAGVYAPNETRVKEISFNPSTLSSFNKITDSNYYQDFSYEINTTKPIGSWAKQFERIIHIAGLKYFANVTS